MISTIGYMGSLTWINSSEVIYAEENKSVELDAALEIVGTTDVIRRNIITGESKILFSGTDQFYYMVFTEDATGEIIVKKRFVGKDSENKADESIVYSSKN